MNFRLTRTVPLVALLMLIATIAAVAQTEGEWWLQKQDDGVQLSFRYSYSGKGDHYQSNWSNTDDPAKLGVAGVLGQQGHVTFDIVRPAGAFKCEGWMTNGKGSGHFTFAPNAQFAAELEKRGLGRPDERQSLKLAMSSTQLSFVDTLKQAGYSFSLDELVRAATHGVSEKYLQEVNSVGLKAESLQELVRMHDHGVSAEYVRELAAAGYKDLPLSGIVRMRDHGVTGEFARELAGVGLKNLSAEQIVRLRDHGVTPEYAKKLAEAGFKGLEPEQIVRMQDHGVSPEFAAAVKREAYPNVSFEELVRLRDHGVSLDFIRENAKGMSVDELIRLRDRGGKRSTMM